MKTVYVITSKDLMTGRHSTHVVTETKEMAMTWIEGYCMVGGLSLIEHEGVLLGVRLKPLKKLTELQGKISVDLDIEFTITQSKLI